MHELTNSCVELKNEFAYTGVKLKTTGNKILHHQEFQKNLSEPLIQNGWIEQYSPDAWAWNMYDLLC